MIAEVVELVLLGVIVASAMLVHERLSGTLRTLARRRVLVSLKTGEGFAGVLWSIDRECVVLRNAEARGVADGGAIPVDGEVVILRPDIAYIQCP